ncbi:Peregrin [Papilio machaon]|uniref:Peregrin n=1 Tax=Papilio machaon TaxID=76193 RepID=A0A0N1IIR9_PAPMA|nr:Peregrin [Papilio machaon]
MVHVEEGHNVCTDPDFAIRIITQNSLLCELVRKRERLKAEHTRVWERCVMHALRPARAALHKLLRLLRQRDTSDVFTEPVDLNEILELSAVALETTEGVLVSQVT